MPVRDTTIPLPGDAIHCRPGAESRALMALGFVEVLPCAIGPWFVSPALPWPLVIGVSLGGATLLALIVAAFFVPHHGADDRGFYWRTTFGRVERVPWESVTAVRLRGRSKQQHGAVYVVEFADRRTVSWSARYTNAEALRDRVAARLDRGAYRAHCDLADDLPARFTFPAWQVRLNAAGMAGVGLGGLAFAVWIGVAMTRLSREPIGVGPWLLFFVVVGPLFVFPSLVVGLLGWRQRHEHCAETLSLDRRGLAVTGGPAPFRAAWSDVLAVTPHRIRGVERLHIVTTAGEFTVPHRTERSPQYLLAERVPAAVREAWERAAAKARGDVPQTLAEGVHLHRMRWRDPRRWVLEAGVAFVVNLPACLALLQRRDGAPLDGAFLAAVALRCALVVLVSRAALSMFRVTVSPAGCNWCGPRHRRRFAWSDVAAVSFPDARSSRLTLRLTDGTLLRCWPTWLAGGLEFLATLRERLATVPRGDA